MSESELTYEDLDFIQDSIAKIKDGFVAKHREAWTSEGESRGIRRQYFFILQYFVAKRIYGSAPNPSAAERLIQEAVELSKKVFLEEVQETTGEEGK